MTFDPHSLDRLRELKGKLPTELSKNKSLKPYKNKEHNFLESEEDPETLFRELINKSPEGDIPSHWLKRLKEIEVESMPNPGIQNSKDLDQKKSPKRQPFKSHIQISSNQLHSNEYTSFHRLLLEEDDEI